MSTARDRSARVCVLTPEGRGAVAVARVWGPRAVEVADAVFRPARGTGLAATAADRPRVGRIGAGAGDEVVAVIVGGDPPEVEVHCHGGPAAVALVVGALVEAGAERRQPAAWVRHDARSTIAAEARVDLNRAATFRAAEILLEQADGALERELAEVLRSAGTDPDGALERVERLLARAAVGLHLAEGWTVALAGRPNVGKSRLLNALAGFERAIVDPAPGTTRDVVTVRTALDGWPVELADTAGLRDADDAVETAGIALARDRQAAADLTLLVLDRSERPAAADLTLIAAMPAALLVANKSDLPAAWDPAEVGCAVIVSAATGEGLDRLAAAVADRLVAAPPEPGAGVPFRPAHVKRLKTLRDAIRAGGGSRL